MHRQPSPSSAKASGCTVESSSSLPLSKPYSAGERGLSATTTQAPQEHEGSVFLLPVFPGSIDFVDYDTGEVFRRDIEEHSTDCSASALEAADSTRAAAFHNAEDLQGTSSRFHPPAQILSAQPFQHRRLTISCQFRWKS